ncbi:Protein scd2/ral3 [Neolecta irregularis DAH-3]|uniref:Protein scd2/ral3 n=1 Tax=Neolecta irregularis (strain DAH-3) TaxID=1198029 RepID=A0A1U7LV86_NEOID|nr:Protein scd2/ral3 [Neolecta irregularis DAH-3]|eukprot:OLL26431.1 Protein scd2/ral3 [Neolecta irregularis DAH-3]
MIKGLRRSLKGERSERSHTISTISSIRHDIPMLPPKRVIKALYDYTPHSSMEMAFSKGDFFHVIGRENDPDWWEACNPVSNMRGLVPVSYFEELGRNERESRSSRVADSGFVEGYQSDQRQSTIGKGQPLYGVVQYDFVAERPDELDAKAGEAIIVIAQSNHEWFVAKPIGRLGGPGLIPISFIEIRDMATGKPIEDMPDLIQRAGVPKVEEWKRMAADYKNSSISLGKFDFDQQKTLQQGSPSLVRASANVNSQFNKQRLPTPPSSQYDHRPSSKASSHGLSDHRPSIGSSTSIRLAAQSAAVDRYAHDHGRYWFMVRAEMEDGRHRNLCRYYEDFYDLQIALLEEFPVEAGRTGTQRVLPYMPGPVTFVNDQITSQRRQDLDFYVREICSLPEYISHGRLICNFFSPREGDVESTHITTSMPQPVFARESFQHSARSSVNSESGKVTGLRISERPSSRATNKASFSSTPSVSIPPAMTRTETVRTNNSSTGSQIQPSFFKIKIFHSDDVIAIRVPLDVTFHQLQDKLMDRLNGRFGMIRYKDDATGDYVNLLNDEDLSTAKRNSKLILYVQ